MSLHIQDTTGVKRVHSTVESLSKVAVVAAALITWGRPILGINLRKHALDTIATSALVLNSDPIPRFAQKVMLKMNGGWMPTVVAFITGGGLRHLA